MRDQLQALPSSLMWYSSQVFFPSKAPRTKLCLYQHVFIPSFLAIFVHKTQILLALFTLLCVWITLGFLILLIQIIFLLNSALTLPGFPADAVTYFLISAFTDTGKLMYFQSSPACLNFPPGMTDEVISVGHRVEN